MVKHLNDGGGAESHKMGRSLIRDFILGGQDGLVNVLGIVLGVATAVSDVRIVIIAGLAATFAESISMGAVAYTSSKAAASFYQSEFEREKREIEEIPEAEKDEVREIYERKGLRGETLEKVVELITSDKRVWLQTMMSEELRLFPDDYEDPLKSGIIVFLSAFLGSVIPLAPFFLVPFLIPHVSAAMIISLGISILTLFVAGWYTAKLTTGNVMRSGIEMAFIGFLAAAAGYVVGALLGASYV